MLSSTPPLCVTAYIVVAVVVSLYQAYRGFMFQWILGLKKIKGALRVILLCIADMLTYFVCTLSGFGALLLLARSGVLEGHLPSTAGEATWLVFLAVYGLLGVTGKLPDILLQVKLPGVKGN